MISILAPSRGRPGGIARLHDSLTLLTVGEWEMVVRLDDDDPAAGDYPRHPRIRYLSGPRAVLSSLWNECWREAEGPVFGLCADDLVFRTQGWDRIVEVAFPDDGIAFVHGDDLSGNDPNLATHGFLRREWTDTVGTFTPPFFSSDYCVSEDTDALTTRGWIGVDDLRPTDRLLALEPDTDQIIWSPLLALTVHSPEPRMMYRFRTSRIDALVTPAHRWLVQKQGVRRGVERPERHFRTAEDVVNHTTNIVVGGGEYIGPRQTWHDDLVELVGWVITEGWANQTSVFVSQSERHNPQHVERIDRLAQRWREQGSAVVKSVRSCGWGPIATYRFGDAAAKAVMDVAPLKVPTWDWLVGLTRHQLELLWDVLMAGDGHVMKRTGTQVWAQVSQDRIDAFQAVSMMLGRRTMSRPHFSGGSTVTTYRGNILHIGPGRPTRAPEEVKYFERVWCPTTTTGTWAARRNGSTFWTGNSDTWLREVADALGRRVLVPVVTEHLHFSFGKGTLDLTHAERLVRHWKDDVDATWTATAPERRAWVDLLRAAMVGP